MVGTGDQVSPAHLHGQGWGDKGDRDGGTLGWRGPGVTPVATSPQAVVTRQDTLLELHLQEAAEKPSRRGSHPVTPTELPARGGEKPGAVPGAVTGAVTGATELALLQRQHALVQEELCRCRQLCQERAQEAAALETRLRDSERERGRLERELEEARGPRQDAAGRRRGGTEPRRRSLPAGDALYLSFTPPQVTGRGRGLWGQRAGFGAAGAVLAVSGV